MTEPKQKESQRVITKVKAIKKRPVKVEVPPDLVRVRALEKGYYGLGVNEIIRNPDEVFDFCTSRMRTFPLAAGEVEVTGATIIQTEKGTFELPGWVELVDEDEEVTASQGHQRAFHGQIDKDGNRTSDVL